MVELIKLTAWQKVVGETRHIASAVDVVRRNIANAGEYLIRYDAEGKPRFSQNTRQHPRNHPPH